MRELILGVVFVGLIAGVILGRSMEQARRASKDWKGAVAAVGKAKNVMRSARQRFTATAAIVCTLLLAAILAAYRNR